MKKSILLLVCALALSLMVACSKDVKDKAKDDPVEALTELAQDVTKHGNDWDTEQWNKAASDFDYIADLMPATLDMSEKAQVVAAVSSIQAVAVLHERSARKMNDALSSADLIGGSSNRSSSFGDNDDDESRIGFSTVDDSQWDDLTTQLVNSVDSYDDNYTSSDDFDTDGDITVNNLDDFLDAYEELVVSFENLCSNYDPTDLSTISQYSDYMAKLQKLSQKADNAQGMFNASQLERYNNLNIRFAKAAERISQ